MTLLDNLVAYWKLDGSSADATGNGHDGSDTSVSYSTSDGKISQGALFGSGSNISVPNAASLQIATAVSISAWVKFSSTGSYHTLLQKGQKYYLRINDSSHKFEFSLNAFSTTLQSASALSTGTWYHVVATYDGSTMALYVNGSLSNSKAQTGAIATSADVLSLGFDIKDGGLNTHLLGDLDEVGLWSRALDATEVSTLYNSGTGKQYPFGISTGGGGNFLPFF